jgi:hypothetical protein
MLFFAHWMKGFPALFQSSFPPSFKSAITRASGAPITRTFMTQCTIPLKRKTNFSTEKTMPVSRFIVFGKIIRRGRRKFKVNNTPLLMFEDTPLSYWDLKDNVFLWVAKNAFENKNQSVVEIEIDKFLGGKGINIMQNYQEKKMHYKKDPQLSATLAYNQLLESVNVVGTVSFISPEFFLKFKDDYDFDRNKKPVLKEVVEKGYETWLHNPESMYSNFSPAKMNLYGESPPPQGYDSHEERTHGLVPYSGRPIAGYAGRTFAIDRDKQEREDSY